EERGAQQQRNEREIMDKEHRRHQHAGTNESEDHEIAARLDPVVRPLENPIADDSTERISHNAAQKHPGGEQRGISQPEMVAVEKIRGDPRQKEPERPSVTEIHDRHGWTLWFF